MTEKRKSAKISLMNDKKDKDRLSKEDQAIWDDFARDIAPQEEVEEEDFAILLDEFEQPSSQKPKAPEPSQEIMDKPSASPLQKRHFDLNPQLDRRTNERLRKGKIPIERRLDLHGYNRSQAYNAIKNFIRLCHKDGLRHVLIITGKGQGIIRQTTIECFSEIEIKKIILKYFTAQPHHGGEGAFYVYLKRKGR